MDDLFRHLHMPSGLAIEFIATFSRMEYALKSTEYANGTGQVVAAWSRFAIDINEAVSGVTDENFLENMNFLIGNPPKTQCREGDNLVFTDMNINGNKLPTQILLEYVCAVRNNLFHGGKFMPEGEVETDRNKNLVEAALVILKHCYLLHPQVKLSFER